MSLFYSKSSKNTVIFFFHFKVDENNNVIPGNWVLCEDERKIIYDWSGAGYFCPIPFVYDRVVYDACTRLPPDDSPGKNSFTMDFRAFFQSLKPIKVQNILLKRHKNAWCSKNIITMTF